VSAIVLDSPPWLEGTDDWSWPGRCAAVELAPAPWVPDLPRVQPAAAVALPVRAATRTPSMRSGLARLGLLALAAATSFVIGAAFAPPAAHRAATTSERSPLTAVSQLTARPSPIDRALIGVALPARRLVPLRW
jgi:hypothetical protein